MGARLSGVRGVAVWFLEDPCVRQLPVLLGPRCAEEVTGRGICRGPSHPEGPMWFWTLTSNPSTLAWSVPPAAGTTAPRGPFPSPAQGPTLPGDYS